MYNKTHWSRLRIMRVILFYDLPSDSETARKTYAFFHNFLIKNGFYMMQESVYGCLARNHDFARLIIQKVQAHSPALGDVRCLLITEQQYQNIQMFSGRKSIQEQIHSINPLVEI